MFVFHCNPPAALELSSFLAPYFPTKISHQNHQHVVFPEHMADLRFRGRESCLRHFRGAAKTANLLRGLSLMRKSCARSFATTKPPRKKAPEGAAARGEGEKQKETDERRGRQRLDKAAGSETQAESLRAEGARRPARAQGSARERSELRARVTALDLARARGPTKRRALFS